MKLPLPIIKAIPERLLAGDLNIIPAGDIIPCDIPDLNPLPSNRRF
jgi:hypothetical protein